MQVGNNMCWSQGKPCYETRKDALKKQLLPQDHTHLHVYSLRTMGSEKKSCSLNLNATQNNLRPN